MAARICELDAVPHALLESCQRPFQIRGTVKGPISNVSKLADGDDMAESRGEEKSDDLTGGEQLLYLRKPSLRLVRRNNLRPFSS
jgi:hypothetical protein